MALTDKLVAVADAIREKGGTTDNLTLDAMPAAIIALQTGDGEDGVPNPITYKDDCSYLFAQGQHDWVMNNYYDRVKFENVSNLSNAFNSAKIEKIPSIKQNAAPIKWEYTFAYCDELKEIGDIEYFNASGYRDMFKNCRKLRYLPNFTGIVQTNLSGTYTSCCEVFMNCHSLRSIPENFLKHLECKTASTSYHLYSCICYGCYALDEINSLPIREDVVLTSNVFYNSFYQCHRLKNLTFQTYTDGRPMVAQWQNQTIELYDGVGWNTQEEGYITNAYNSGISKTKRIYDELTYPALKDDADAYTSMVEYSRFNHDSAVNLINSLPDTSAYLATQTDGTNTVVLRNAAGSLTDGGSCGSLTEEEIAVAAAKGWTITYKT